MPDDFNDDELLAQHHAGSADAFAAIVRRHADWISGVARRRVGHDAGLADDVVQATFLVLAQRSRTIGRGVPLSAWLFRVACNVASRAVRDRQRRQRHERQSTMAPRPDEPNEEWAALAPVVDGLVDQLRQADREAILLRFYRQQTYAEVGRALGVGDEAARKRVDRALERLRDAARRRGIQVGATATFAALLVTGLTPGTATAGVVAIATTAATTNHAVAGGNAAALAKGAMAMTKATTLLAAAAGAAALVTAGAIVLHGRPAGPVAATRPTTSAATAPAAAGSEAVATQIANLNTIAKAVLPGYLSDGGNEQLYPRTVGALFDRAAHQPGASPVALAKLFVPPGPSFEPPPDASGAWLDAHPWLALVFPGVDVAGWTPAQRSAAVAMHTPLEQPFERGGDLPVVVVAYADGRAVALPPDQARAEIVRTMRVVASAPGQAEQEAIVRTMSNLRMIGQMLNMSAAQDRGRLPATLGAAFSMWDGKLGVGPDDTAIVFLTPADLARIGKANVEATPQWVDANGSFVYFGGGAKLGKIGNAASTTVIAHTKLDVPLPRPRKGPVVVALYVDGHVETLKPEAAPTLIEASKKALDVAR